MWIELFGGKIRPGIIYHVMPQEEFDALVKSHDKLLDAHRNIHDEILQYYNGYVVNHNYHSIDRIATQAVKDGEKIK